MGYASLLLDPMLRQLILATALGLIEISLSPPENDAHEKSAKLTPQVRALDGIFFDSRAIPVAREGGVTSVVAQPVGNVIAGTSVLYRVSGGSPRRS